MASINSAGVAFIASIAAILASSSDPAILMISSRCMDHSPLTPNEPKYDKSITNIIVSASIHCVFQV